MAVTCFFSVSCASFMAFPLLAQSHSISGSQDHDDALHLSSRSDDVSMAFMSHGPMCHDLDEKNGIESRYRSEVDCVPKHMSSKKQKDIARSRI